MTREDERAFIAEPKAVRVRLTRSEASLNQSLGRVRGVGGTVSEERVRAAVAGARADRGDKKFFSRSRKRRAGGSA